MADYEYEIDSEVLLPQPDSHQWEPTRDGVAGFDGDGKPFKRKYRVCTLLCRHPLAYHAWSAFDDGATHTVRLPAPGGRADQWTDYTTCYVVVSEGTVIGGSAIDGIEMTVFGAAAF